METWSSRLQQQESSLDELRRKFEAMGAFISGAACEAHPAPAAGQWKLGDMAIRRGKGFCELSMLQLDVQPPFFEARPKRRLALRLE